MVVRVSSRMAHGMKIRRLQRVRGMDTLTIDPGVNSINVIRGCHHHRPSIGLFHAGATVHCTVPRGRHSLTEITGRSQIDRI